MLRHGNQTLINIMPMKSEPIASDSPWLMFRLIEDQGCKHNDKKFGLFVRKLSFSRSKNGFFIFCSSGVINVWICCVDSIPPGPLIKKFCLVRIRLSHKPLPMTGSSGEVMARHVYDALEKFDGLESIRAILFDNSSVNSGWKNGLVVR